jgi:AcrR family transcriptional regulator
VGEPTTDRRVRRTRTLLRQALFDLIVEKGYDHTTVQDILDRADVGRSTFYSHYPTKDQLLLSGLDELRDVLQHTTGAFETDSRQPLLAPLRPMFDHVEGHGQLFRVMLGDRANALAYRTGRRVLAETISPYLRDRLAIDDQDELDLTVTFLVDGLIGVLTWWRESKPDLPAAQVYDRFERLAARGLEPG